MTSLLIWAGIITLASLAGVGFSIGPAHLWMKKNMSYLTPFAAGVFLVTSFFLVREVFELASVPLAISSIVGGFLLFFVIQYLIPESHHHHDDACDSHDHTSAIKILIGDTFHNIGDGIILVPAFFISTELGIITAVSILIHELLQSISQYFVIRHAGYSHGRTLAYNFITALTIFVGVGIGLVLTHTETLQAIILGISAGAFLQIVFHDLVPHGHGHDKKLVAKQILAFILGIASIVVINILLPHEHEHKEDIEHANENVFDFTPSQEVDAGAIQESEQSSQTPLQ